MLEVGIIGGGLSGLLTAHRLRKRGIRARVFEASHRVGGWVQSERREGSVIEWGPNTLMAGKEWLDLCDDLELEPLFALKNLRRRFIWRGGRKRRLPMNPLALFASSLISSSAKLSLFRDLFATNRFEESDLSISDFISRSLHLEILESFVQPFVSGIYAGDVDSLSASACFPSLWDAKKNSGSLIRGLFAAKKKDRPQMISFQEGLESLTSALAHDLGAFIYLNHGDCEVTNESSGWSLRTSHGVYRFSHLVVATPSGGAHKILKAILPVSSAEFLQSIPYQSVLVWNTIFRRPENFEAGFGCLVPRSEGESLLGSLWSSEIFKSRSRPDRLVTTQFFSGPGIPSDPTEHLRLLARILNLSEADLVWSGHRLYKQAIPQFQLGHRSKVEELRQSLPKNLFLAGNYLDGVGLSQLISTSYSVADQILKQTS